MGGGASKGKQKEVVAPSSTFERAQSSSPKAQPSSSNQSYLGPRNGELAPIPQSTTNKLVRNTPDWYGGYSTPLAPIVPKSTSPPLAPSPPTVVSSPVSPISITPSSSSSSSPPPPPRVASPPPVVADQQEKGMGDRKMSDGVNSPIVRYKNNLTQSANHNANLSDDDQVVMDKDDLMGDEEPGVMASTASKSKADQFYEKFADKMKKDPEVSPSHSLNISLDNNKPRPPQFKPLGDSDDDGLYTEYEDSFKGMDFLEKKAVAVPTLKLGELGGEKRSKPPAAAAAVKPPPEVLPVVKHGNFDNSKFRAANANVKKKPASDIFQQTTYDYTLGAAKNPDSPASVKPDSPESERSNEPDSPSSYEYSSDTSDFPEHVMRLPNTPTYKQTFDEFEEKLIDSILQGDSKINSPA